MEHRVNKLLHQNIETTIEVAETLSSTVAIAGQQMANALLNEGKILVAGNGICGALGQLFVSSLINHLHYERPGLPALSLQADAVAVTAIAASDGIQEVYAKQIRVLGNDNDILLVITANDPVQSIDQAILTARDKNLNIVVLCTHSNNAIDTVLNSNDLVIRLPNVSLAATHQAQLQILLALTDLIDFQLFGVGDNL